MQNLESLSRSELQALIKEHKLKGANKKTFELVNMLQEFFNSPLTPSPSVNDLSKDMETLVVSLDTNLDTNATESHDMTALDSEKESSKEEKIEPQISVSQDLKERLLITMSHETIAILEKEELLDWDLLNQMEFKDFENLGLKMVSFIKLRKILKEKFPKDNQVMVPLSEIKSIVQNILESKTSGIPKPILGAKPVENIDAIKKFIRKPGKYDNVKSKVAQQWNHSRV